jgi:predicted phosphodiesterase
MSDSPDAQALVQAVKNLAIELGHTPTRAEFQTHIAGAYYRTEKYFGTHTLLLQAAGLETYSERRSAGRKRLSREDVYGAPIEDAIEQHTPRVVNTRPEVFKPMLLIGDTHFPFAHQKTLDRIYRFAEAQQPDFIVQMGDLMDQWSHSRFPQSRNYYRPDEEMELARTKSQEFWLELIKACPNAQRYQLVGNHDVRALKQILEKAPSLESLVSQSITKLYEFEGVTTVHDYREELVIQGIMLHHGYMSRHGQQRDFVLQDLATAHTHKGAVVHRALKDRTITHLDCGFTGDAESKALSYTPQKHTGWTLGWGFWDEYGARFIPT